MVHEQTVQHLLADADIFEYDLDSELEILTQLDEFVACDDVVWDVGAHSGLYGIFISRLYPQIDVYCFEPAETVLTEYLYNNIDSLSNITVIEKALADTTGSQQFLQTKNSATVNALKGEIIHPGDVPDVDSYEQVTVETITATDAVQNDNIPIPDFVKIDVEGAEHRVLDGFGGVLSDVRTLLIEVHYDDSTPQRLDDIRYRLTNAGFTVTELAHREPRIQQTHLLAERE